jgi:UDP:flavonoid glycosyltransferase YjiC (YdhE family)
VFGCPELDAYGPFRHDPLCLPPEPLPEFVEPPIEPRIFVYLGPELPRIETFLQSLAELDVPLEVYLRGEIAPLGRFLALRGHQVYGEPPPLADVLPRVSHVICGAGAFTCHAALAAGRPVLALPSHGESTLNAAALEKLGVAKRLEPQSDASDIRAGVTGFLRDHALLRKARFWAKVLATRPQPDGLSAAVNAVRLCLEQPYVAVLDEAARPIAVGVTS